MIAYIRGKVLQVLQAHVIIEAGGIGYKLLIAANVYGKIPSIGEEAALHTSFVVRELSQTLYGFLTLQERDFFEALMGVTGIGPKLALAIIGHMPLAELQRAIGQGDIPAICRIPGIGKKNAERLIIEMRDKVHGLAVDPSDFIAYASADPKASALSQRIHDAMSALINLGYNQMTAQKAIKKSLGEMAEEGDLPSLITAALSHIASVK